MRFVYVPGGRRWYRWLLDVAVVVVVLWVVRERAWRWELDCAWQGTRASCVRVSEDSFGRRKEQRVEGIRGLAFVKDMHVGFVTDASHADEFALFGMNEITVGDAAQADEVRRFADERSPKTIAYRAGLPHPVLVTLAGLLAIFAWGFFTRTRKFYVEVDRESKSLRVARGLLRGEVSFPLASVTPKLESARGGARVALVGKGEAFRFDESYHSGTHHAEFVERLKAALPGGEGS